MRIAFLTQLFDPEPTAKGLEFARALRERGHDVEVVTGFPNYPGGKVYDGYAISPLKREIMEGVPVTRLAIYPSHDRSALRRILCYGSFMVSSWLYLTLWARRFDVVYVYYPSLTAGLAAIAMKLFRRARIIVDIQDMWPDSLRSTGMVGNERVLSYIDRVSRFMYRHVDHVMVLSPGFERLLVERGVPPEKISVHYNWTHESPDEGTDPTPPGFETGDRFRVLFAGNIGAAQGIDTVLDAAALTLAIDPGVEFHLLGTGIEVERLKERVAVESLTNVSFSPRVSTKSVRAYFAAADALLVNLRRDELFRITIPSKTQAYLYAGRPIVMACDGDAADMVVEADAGVTCDPGDPQALCGAVLSLRRESRERLEQIGRNGRRFYDENLSFEKAMVRFDDLLDRVAGRG